MIKLQCNKENLVNFDFCKDFQDTKDMDFNVQDDVNYIIRELSD